MKRIAFLFFVFLGCTKADVNAPTQQSQAVSQTMKVVVTTKFATPDSIAYFIDNDDTSKGVYYSGVLEYIDGFIKNTSQTYTRNLAHTSGGDFVQISLWQQPFGTVKDSAGMWINVYDSIACTVYIGSKLVYSGTASHGVLVADIPY